MKKNIICTINMLFCLFAFAEPRIVVQDFHRLDVRKVSYNCNDKFITSADDTTFKIWTSNTGMLLHTIKKFDEMQKNADISPDGKVCAYISPNGTVELCDLVSENVTTLDTKLNVENKTYYLSFAGVGSLFAVSDFDKIHIYDSSTKQKLFSLSEMRYYKYQVPKFSSDGRYLAVLASTNEQTLVNAIVIWNLQTRNIASVIRVDNVSHSYRNLNLSKDGKRLVVSHGQTMFNASNKNSLTYDYYIDVIDFDSSNVTNKIKLDYSPSEVKLSSDGRTIFVAGDNEKLNIYNVKQPAKIKAFSFDAKINCLDVGSASLLVGCGKQIHICSLVNFENILTIGSKVDELEDATFLPKRNWITKIKENNIDVVDNISSYQKGKIKQEIENIAESSITDSGIVFYKKDKLKQQIWFYDFDKRIKTKLLDIKEFFGQPKVIKNSNENIVALRYDKDIFVYNIKTGENKKYQTASNNYPIEYVSPTGKFIISDTLKPLSLLQYSDGFDENAATDKSTIYEIATGNKIMTDNCYVVCSNDDRYIAMMDSPHSNEMINYNYGENVIIYDTSNWKFIRFLGKYESYFSNTGSYFLSHTDGFVHLYDCKSWQQIKSIPTENGKFMGFCADDKRFVFKTSSGTLEYYATDSGELLSTTVVGTNGDLVTFTPEGYYSTGDSETKPDSLVHLVDDMNVTSLDQFEESLYRPDLIEAKLNDVPISQEVKPESLKSLVESGAAPLIEFVDAPTSSVSRDIEITFKVQDAGGGIGDVFLSINGKTIKIADGTRGLKLVNSAKTKKNDVGRTVVFSHTFSLASGDNLIRAYSYNSENKVKSNKPAEISIHWKGKVGKPNLYVLSAGINKYNDRNLWLNYAVPDAVSISESFNKSKCALYETINVQTLLDEKVTKSGLEETFNSLAESVKPDDVFVFYLSGHGMMHSNGDYYYIPVDLRYHNEDDLIEGGVSKQFLIENLSKISAGKSLILLDTCNSGAFLGEGTRGMTEKTMIDRLNRAMGQAIITAANDTQVAMEGYNNHGVFTYATLQGLSGDADYNNDNYISVTELALYIGDTVPDLCMEKWHYDQTPNYSLNKMNFTLTDKIQGVLDDNTDYYEVGLKAYNSDDYAKALKNFNRAAEKNHPKAQNYLGIMHENGYGTEVDFDEAFKWYKLSADQNEKEGQCNLGYMYNMGRGVEENDVQAVYWYRKSAEQGLDRGQFNLGVMCANGFGTDIDYVEAIKWYTLSAEQDFPAAQNNLGYMYDNGLGVAIDYQLAVKWYAKSAGHGEPLAQNNLGTMYEAGHGIEKDYGQALNLYLQSSNQGCSIAKENYERLLRKINKTATETEMAFVPVSTVTSPKEDYYQEEEHSKKKQTKKVWVDPNSKYGWNTYRKTRGVFALGVAFNIIFLYSGIACTTAATTLYFVGMQNLLPYYLLIGGAVSASAGFIGLMAFALGWDGYKTKVKDCNGDFISDVDPKNSYSWRSYNRGKYALAFGLAFSSLGFYAGTMMSIYGGLSTFAKLGQWSWSYTTSLGVFVSGVILDGLGLICMLAFSTCWSAYKEKVRQYNAKLTRNQEVYALLSKTSIDGGYDFENKIVNVGFGFKL